jgi:hypothetical protein
MAASARVAYLARRASDFGVQTGRVEVNLAQVKDKAEVSKFLDSFKLQDKKDAAKPLALCSTPRAASNLSPPPPNQL